MANLCEIAVYTSWERLVGSYLCEGVFQNTLAEIFSNALEKHSKRITPKYQPSIFSITYSHLLHFFQGLHKGLVKLFASNLYSCPHESRTYSFECKGL